MGLDRLEQTIPYLYGTCDNLGQIRIRRPERTVVFRRESPPGTGIKDIDGFLLKEAIVTASEGAATRQFAAISILAKAETGLDGAAGGEHASAGLLLILKQDDGQKGSIVFPEPGFPRIFVQFPINETGALPFNIVFESRFNPKQERDGITMNPDDRRLLKAALSAFPSYGGVCREFRLGECEWTRAYRRAASGPRGGDRSFGGTGLVERSNRRSRRGNGLEANHFNQLKGTSRQSPMMRSSFRFLCPRSVRRNDSLSTTIACTTWRNGLPIFACLTRQWRESGR